MIEGETDEFEIHFQWLKTVIKRIDSYGNEETRIPLLSLEFCQPLREFSHEKYQNNEISQSDLNSGTPYAILFTALSPESIDTSSAEKTFSSILENLEKMGYKPSNECTPTELANGNLKHHTSLCLILEWLIVDKSLTIDDICKDLQRLPRSFYILEQRPTMLEDAVQLWMSKFPTMQNLPECKSLSTDLLTGQHIAVVLARVFPTLINQKEVCVGDNLNEEQISKNWDFIMKVANNLSLFVPPRKKISQQLLYVFIADIFAATRPAAKKFVKLDQPKPIELLPMPVSQEQPKPVVQQLPKKVIPYSPPVKPEEKPKPKKKENKQPQKQNKEEKKDESANNKKDEAKNDKKDEIKNDKKDEAKNDKKDEIKNDKKDEAKNDKKDDDKKEEIPKEREIVEDKQKEENKNDSQSKENVTNASDNNEKSMKKTESINHSSEHKENGNNSSDNSRKSKKESALNSSDDKEIQKQESDNNKEKATKESSDHKEKSNKDDSNKEKQEINSAKLSFSTNSSSSSKTSSENFAVTKLNEESLHESSFKHSSQKSLSSSSKSNKSSKSKVNEKEDSSSLNQVIVISDKQEKMKYELKKNDFNSEPYKHAPISVSSQVAAKTNDDGFIRKISTKENDELLNSIVSENKTSDKKTSSQSKTRHKHRKPSHMSSANHYSQIDSSTSDTMKSEEFSKSEKSRSVKSSNKSLLNSVPTNEESSESKLKSQSFKSEAKDIARAAQKLALEATRLKISQASEQLKKSQQAEPENQPTRTQSQPTFNPMAFTQPALSQPIPPQPFTGFYPGPPPFPNYPMFASPYPPQFVTPYPFPYPYPYPYPPQNQITQENTEQKRSLSRSSPSLRPRNKDTDEFSLIACDLDEDDTAAMADALRQFYTLPPSMQTQESLRRAVKNQYGKYTDPDKIKNVENSLLALLKRIVSRDDSIPRMLLEISSNLFKDGNAKTTKAIQTSEVYHSDSSDDNKTKSKKRKHKISSDEDSEPIKKKHKKKKNHSSDDDDSSKKSVSEESNYSEPSTKSKNKTKKSDFETSKKLDDTSPQKMQVESISEKVDANIQFVSPTTAIETQTAVASERTLKIEPSEDVFDVKPRKSFSDEPKPVEINSFKFSEYQRVEKKPYNPRNTQIMPNINVIKLALTFNLMPNERNDHKRDDLIAALSGFPSDRIILLLSSITLKYKGSYILDDNCTKCVRFHGLGPGIIHAKDVGKFLKFNTSTKQFDELQSFNYTQTTDAICMKRELEPQSW